MAGGRRYRVCPACGAASRGSALKQVRAPDSGPTWAWCPACHRVAPLATSRVVGRREGAGGLDQASAGAERG